MYEYIYITTIRASQHFWWCASKHEASKHWARDMKAQNFPLWFHLSSARSVNASQDTNNSPRKTEQHTEKKKKEEKETFPAALLRAARGIFKRTALHFELGQNFGRIKFRPLLSKFWVTTVSACPRACLAALPVWQVQPEVEPFPPPAVHYKDVKGGGGKWNPRKEFSPLFGLLTSISSSPPPFQNYW